ncbi:MAG: phosphoglycerate kinase [Candidatus Micrarchaeota archaeon]|nr:phosphoglycerate kinase [Candidatus Micrarchaeota archaeon]MDE1848189.1 phosphoglycerate kinase [Candidatus Micrarchaeota archaeon]MDE1864836.1 phosphoglycerate kinase [Candidatus Micrarchaeota archaeon]
MDIDESLAMLERRGLSSFNANGKTVVIRADINSPIKNGTIENISKIKVPLPTITGLIRQGGKVVILSHQGRPGDEDFITLRGHAAVLRELGVNVDFIAENSGGRVKNRIRQMQNGDALLLENVRFDAQEMKKVENYREHLRSPIVQDVGAEMDYFVEEDFSCMHRNEATVTGLPFAAPSYLGLHMEQELRIGSMLRKSTSKPTLFVMGGGKVHDAIGYLYDLAQSGFADSIFLTGLVGNVAIMAMNGKLGGDTPMLKQKYGNQIRAMAKFLSEYNSINKHLVKIPVDVATMDANGRRVEYEVNELPLNASALDIGSRTIQLARTEICTANSLFNRGPSGRTDVYGFAFGTYSFLEAAIDRGVYTVIAGAHTKMVADQFNLTDRINENGHVSSGGGAMVAMLAGKKLPAIEATAMSLKLELPRKREEGRRKKLSLK